MSTAKLPIIPVGTVLFPGGVLPLKVVDVQHLDMVRNCLRDEGLFGVCLFSEDREASEPAEVGCTARVTDFESDSFGRLVLRIVGEQRFRILESYQHPEGWVEAVSEMLDPDPATTVPPELRDCSDLIKRLVQDLEAKERNPMRRMIAEPYQFEVAAWVSNRLSEFLPIPSSVRQKLMALNDAHTRLCLIHSYLEHHGLFSTSN